MMKLKGYVKSETKKAILFEITSDECGFHLEGQTEWFPISHTRLPKKLYGKEISIYVQNWLYDSKIHIDEGGGIGKYLIKDIWPYYIFCDY